MDRSEKRKGEKHSSKKIVSKGKGKPNERRSSGKLKGEQTMFHTVLAHMLKGIDIPKALKKVVGGVKINPDFLLSVIIPLLENNLPVLDGVRSVAIRKSIMESDQDKYANELKTFSSMKVMIYQAMGGEMDSGGTYTFKPMWECTNINQYVPNSSNSCWKVMGMDLNTLVNVTYIQALFAEYRMKSGTWHILSLVNQIAVLTANGYPVASVFGVDPSSNVIPVGTAGVLCLDQGQAVRLDQTNHVEHTFNARSEGIPDEAWTPVNTNVNLAYLKFYSKTDTWTGSFNLTVPIFTWRYDVWIQFRGPS